MTAERKKPELLAPAGDWEKLQMAVLYGADAVYLGFGPLNARRNAKNFTREELEAGVAYCHLRGVKVYLTLNTLLFDRELDTAAQAGALASDLGVDAVWLSPFYLSPQHDAGYDVAGDLDGVLEAFDRTIGLDRLRAVHLNDSMNPRGSRKDRHARIGHGHLGLKAVVSVINHPALHRLPFLLETPNELPGYAEEIALLRGLYRS